MEEQKKKKREISLKTCIEIAMLYRFPLLVECWLRVIICAAVFWCEFNAIVWVQHLTGEAPYFRHIYTSAFDNTSKHNFVYINIYFYMFIFIFIYTHTLSFTLTICTYKGIVSIAPSKQCLHHLRKHLVLSLHVNHVLCCGFSWLYQRQ